MCPRPHTWCETEPGLGRGLLAPGHSGDSQGKWNSSDEKVLTGRSAGPKEVRPQRTWSLPTQHCRATVGPGSPRSGAEGCAGTSGGVTSHSQGGAFPTGQIVREYGFFGQLRLARHSPFTDLVERIALGLPEVPALGVLWSGGPSRHLGPWIPGRWPLPALPHVRGGASPATQSLHPSCSPTWFPSGMGGR